MYNQVGENNGNYKHGGKGTVLYSRWKGMKSRCYNKNRLCYKDYGGRGITVCGDWGKNFHQFRDDMHDSFQKHCKKYGVKNTFLDRVDNDRIYSKENCRWATRLEQAQNTRQTIKITILGETYPLGWWAKMRKIPRYIVYNRICKNGWSPDIALLVPSALNNIYLVTGEVLTTKNK